MTDANKLQTAIERSTKALTLKPSLGLGTGKSTARIINGLTCEVEEGNWKFMVDMPETIGGNAKGPTPGVYGRGAFGACLSIGYMIWATKMNIPVTKLEVHVQADYDDGALLGTANVSPGYSEVRYTITIESSASKEDVLKMLDDADMHSPYLNIFSAPQQCKRDVIINSSKQ